MGKVRGRISGYLLFKLPGKNPYFRHFGVVGKFLFYLLTDLNLPRPKIKFFGNNMLVMERYFVEL